MRFLVYTLLFLFIPLVGFTQVTQAHGLLDSLLAIDASNHLERGGYTPPPSVMVAGTDNCSAAATALVANGTTAYTTNSAATVAGTDPANCAIFTNNSVWFTYNVTSAGTLVAIVKGTTQKGSSIAIYSGSCGAFTLANQLGCGAVVTNAVGTATATATCLQPGIYYVLVEDATSGTYSITTAFTNTVSDPGPTNNCCSNAIDVSTSLNSTPIVGTTSLATNDAAFSGGCNTTYNNVWYSFVAQGPNIEITATGTATPQFNVLMASGSPTDVCTSTGVSSVLCGTTSTPVNNVAGTPLIVGQMYYISVVNTSTVGLGTFSLTVNNPVPNPNGTDCATATRLCSSTLPYVATGGNSNLWGYQDLTALTGDCMGGANNEIHSAWYYVSVLTGGTLNMSLASTVAYNYDFSIWKSTTTNICDNLDAISLVSCNSYNATSTSGGLNAVATTTFTSSGPTSFNTTLTTTSGDVYAILVNSPAISGTYTVNITGTSILSCTTPVILPIELAEFTATQNGNEVDLKWTTVSEKNNSYFTIERSADGQHFETLNKVKSAAENGNSTSMLYYADVDYAPLAATSYYRLSQTDNNGKVNKLTIVSVINKDNDGAFTIAPNPTDGTLNITYNCQTATTGVFKLYDSNGAEVLNQEVVCALGNNKTQVDLSDKINGIYFATFTTNTSFYRTKLIKK